MTNSTSLLDNTGKLVRTLLDDEENSEKANQTDIDLPCRVDFNSLFLLGMAS